MINFIEVGQQITLHGEIYRVVDVNDVTDIITLVKDGECSACYGKSMVMRDGDIVFNANTTKRTKAEIDARTDELRELLSSTDFLQGQCKVVTERIHALIKERETAQDDMMTAIVRSHEAICSAKQMGVDAAYGHDPAIYYSLGLAGECGELCGGIVKAMRNSNDRQAVINAIIGELPDCVIYSHILAFTLGIDLTKLVNEKVEIVIERAKNGYYGGKLKPTAHTPPEYSVKR